MTALAPEPQLEFRGRSGLPFLVEHWYLGSRTRRYMMVRRFREVLEHARPRARAARSRPRLRLGVRHALGARFGRACHGHRSRFRSAAVGARGLRRRCRARALAGQRRVASVSRRHVRSRGVGRDDGARVPPRSAARVRRDRARRAPRRPARDFHAESRFADRERQATRGALEMAASFAAVVVFSRGGREEREAIIRIAITIRSRWRNSRRGLEEVGFRSRGRPALPVGHEDTARCAARRPARATETAAEVTPGVRDMGATTLIWAVRT